MKCVPTQIQVKVYLYYCEDERKCSSKQLCHQNSEYSIYILANITMLSIF